MLSEYSLAWTAVAARAAMAVAAVLSCIFFFLRVCKVIDIWSLGLYLGVMIVKVGQSLCISECGWFSS